jgi:hypothetical protein
VKHLEADHLLSIEAVEQILWHQGSPPCPWSPAIPR